MTRPVDVEQRVSDWWQVVEWAMHLADLAPELARLAGMVSGPDGYGSGNTDRGGPGTVARPTEAVIVKAAGGKVRGDTIAGIRVDDDTPDTWALGADHVAKLLEVVDRKTPMLLAEMRAIAGAVRLIEARADGRVGRQSSLQADCLACEADVSGVGNDRLRAGYCPACFKAFRRYASAEMDAGREPIHSVFRKQRASQLTKEAKAS